jgi:phenylacetate-coenzyme A ligase PaaK-like adenylate-forming protein
MRLGYNVKRLQDVVRSLFIKKKLASHDRWQRGELFEFQRRQLSSLVKHAISHSPFYRELYSHVDTRGDVLLNDLPIIDKARMMENFDRFVTDPRLKLADLHAHIRQLTRDEYYLGEYRVLTTSGSSGMKGVFVSNRREWSTALACFFRCGEFMGLSPRFPIRWRIASIGGDSPIHVTYRMSVSADIGLHKTLRLQATSSIEDLVHSLSAFQPDVLVAYSSIAALLACEQLEGRLSIHPRVVSTTSEVRTEDMERKIREAWGGIPFNNYGMTEAGIVFGSDCSFHHGMHVFEDLFIVEVVDEHNRAVADGSPGHKLLITNLINNTQPLIRYEVSDMITLSQETCPCGRPMRLIAKMEGRSDDIIYLKSSNDFDIPIHPIHFHSALGTFPEIKQYRIVQEEDGIYIDVVPRGKPLAEKVGGMISERVRGDIEAIGAICPDIHVKFIERMDRDPRLMGKLKLVKSNIRRQILKN